MKLLRLPVIISLLILFSLPMVLCSHAPVTDRILRVADSQILSLSDIVKDLAESRLVFVGELHTAKSHHRAQLETIRALKEAGAPVAIGFEMFRRDSQPDLDRWITGELSEQNFEQIYYKKNLVELLTDEARNTLARHRPSELEPDIKKQVDEYCASL